MRITVLGIAVGFILIAGCRHDSAGGRGDGAGLPLASAAVEAASSHASAGELTLGEQVQTARPGTILKLAADITLETVPVLDTQQTPRTSAQFLFSDKPEYFRTGNGIAMQEDVLAGTVRVYFYHVPTPRTEAKVLSAVIENRSGEPMTIHFTHYAFPKPGGDYNAIGKEGLRQYLDPATPLPADRVVPPHGRALIDPAMEAKAVKTDQLVHLLHEFVIDRPARVTTFQRDPDQDSLTIIDSLEKLPRRLPGQQASGAGRGLFDVSDYDVASKATFDAKEGPRQILVADGKRDPWVAGRDSYDVKAPNVDQGNYGVFYHVTIPYRSAGRVAVVMAHHRADSKGCRFVAATVKVNAGDGRSELVSLPSAKVSFEPLPQGCLIGVWPAGEGVIDLVYSPPGASCLPTPILLLPVAP